MNDVVTKEGGRGSENLYMTSCGGGTEGCKPNSRKGAR